MQNKGTRGSYFAAVGEAIGRELGSTGGAAGTDASVPGHLPPGLPSPPPPGHPLPSLPSTQPPASADTGTSLSTQGDASNSPGAGEGFRISARRSIELSTSGRRKGSRRSHP